MTDNNTTTKVVVIGGGYAGTLAANHLRMRADVDITLVNPRPKFVERIRLHQFVAGSGDCHRRLRHAARRGRAAGRRHRRPDRHRLAQVQLASGAALDYDYLIYAVGSTGGRPRVCPGRPNSLIP